MLCQARTGMGSSSLPLHQFCGFEGRRASTCSTLLLIMKMTARPCMDTCSLHLGALDTNFRRARDFTVRLVANVARLPNLRSLDLSGSGVSQLPPSLLYACTSLTHLSLDSCRMKALPAGLNRLSGLVHLSAANSTRLQVALQKCGGAFFNPLVSGDK